MSTLDTINERGAELISRLKKGESLTKKEFEEVKIYNLLHSKKAGNAGKRKVIKTGK